MRKKALWLTVVLVAGTMIMLLGCKAKEKGEEAEDSARPAKERPAPAKDKPQTKVVLTCGMPGHPQFESGKEPENGKCPVCEMKLVEKEIPAEKPQ